MNIYLLMPRYQFSGDRHTIEAVTSDPADILIALREGSWFHHAQTDSEFMQAMAERIKAYASINISTESPEAFIDGLILNGFLIRVD